MTEQKPDACPKCGSRMRPTKSPPVQGQMTGFVVRGQFCNHCGHFESASVKPTREDKDE